MASSYTGLGTELMTTGENAGTWGTTTNTNLQIIEQLGRRRRDDYKDGEPRIPVHQQTP